MTHLQHAQPVLFAHQLLAHVHAFARDADRLRDWDKRAAISPLGAGALAGSSLPLDPRSGRASSASTAAATNSMDAVSDRDFAAEFCFAAALIGVHLSRLGEEIVLWSSQEFGWIEIDDAYATGSSIMPQKKNPDVAELARGKAGRPDRRPHRAADHAQGPAADLQPRPAGGQGAGVRRGRHAAAGAARHGRADRDAPAPRRADGGAAPAPGFTLATDLAEYLVQRGVPFREAHEIVGHLVVWCQVHDVRPGRRRATRTWRRSRRT